MKCRSLTTFLTLLICAIVVSLTYHNKTRSSASEPLTPAIAVQQLDMVQDPLHPRADTDTHTMDPVKHTPSTKKLNNVTVTPSLRCRQGYILSLSYFDQISNALGRMTSLQCLASQHNMAVVEPFLPSNSTYPGMPEVGENTGEALKLRDLFDLDHWNKYISRVKGWRKTSSFSPLVTWEEFVECAPREVVAVQIIHRRLESSSLPCSYPWINRYWASTFEPRGFKISNHVCIDHNKVSTISEEELKRLIFGSTNVTLIFDQWRGIVKTSKPNECITSNSRCTNELGRDTLFKGLIPSISIRKSAERYKKLYLQNQPYLAILLRIERIVLTTRDLGKSCLHDIANALSTKNATSRPIFISTDVGTYGSQSFQQCTGISADYFSDYIRHLFEILYGDKGPQLLKDYDKAFERISYSTHPLYISTLQKAIASQGECLVLLGGGHFQNHAKGLYSLAHRKKDCVEDNVCQLGRLIGGGC